MAAKSAGLMPMGFVESVGERINALFVQMAYYGPRRPSEGKVRLLSTDIPRTLDAVRQTVFDVRVAGNWLATRPENDPARVGMYGHSYGAATAGRVAQEDPRVLAAMPIAAPVENPFFPNTHVADIHVPLLSVLAEEDNSIGALGNNLIELNFNAENKPARLIRVTDAGHWNFTDICGLTMGFSAGCGDGERQTMPGVQFTYLDIEIGRGIASAYALRTLLGRKRTTAPIVSFGEVQRPENQALCEAVGIDVKNAGGRYVDRPFVEDGNVITARKWDDVPALTDVIVRILSSNDLRT